MTEVEFKVLGVAVVTVSDTRTSSTDKSGPLAAQRLREAGHRIVESRIVRDDVSQIQEALLRLLEDDAAQAIVLTGGTGLTARDVTLEALTPLVDKWIVGFGELFRSLSFQEIGASTIQSRSEAALCRKTLVFALPGSQGAVRLAMDKIIVPQLDARTRPCNFAQLISRF